MPHTFFEEPTMECINLRERFGQRFRVTCEESCKRTHHNSQCDPWYAIILCERGHIGVQGGDRLLACTSHRGPTACKLAALPMVTITQDGDDGINASFHIDHFETVAKLMQPKKRRQLTPEQHERLVARGRATILSINSTRSATAFRAPTNANDPA